MVQPKHLHQAKLTDSSGESVSSYQVNNQDDDYEEVINQNQNVKACYKAIEEDADDEMAFFNKLAEE